MVEKAVWREQMNLGYEPLDSEHKGFLDVVNKAQDAAEDRNFTAVEEVFDACYEYARKHFSHEENIMEKVDYPEIMPHMKSHQIFIKNVSDLRSQFETSTGPEEQAYIARQLADFLNVWLIGHIISRDKLYQPCLSKLSSEN